ncbi:MAG TPA: voltage-gated chloride channel [Deltaproteobacteria bacterium]|nr:MAG: voltage-gated chloride channel [Deltaproteobacteria bacterium GWA2_55_82]OGQ62099.1 MAG: voltage-gated chloride channel [Deltaproteobacteria bacterium RIFCSPLOWO2_02_FULL_55_12]OIJ74041.1 MAG: voltage-gated chloride channel [Deltaproteobacteria bacterium GWC2_55_46]HBG46650.1 voltage-gated chloride channel [Deltaproteobacteria bacterium]HCY11342.1 voltage-gated chloride channel [Deltaproteobacteria bacterium]
MRRKIREETVIFISVIKWIFLATIVGAIVGVSTTAFVKSLNWGAAIASRYDYYFLLIPVGFLLSAIIIKYVFPQAAGHGANSVIESIHKNAGKIRPIAVPVEFVRTFLTITTGGSAGKEGPSAQIGAGLASLVADALRFEGADRRKLVICGISGGFASVFGTPLAGAIFGMEVLFVGSILYDVLLPSFVAGIISYQVSSWLGLTYFYNPVTFIPVFSESFFLKVIAAGVFFGLCSFLLVETLRLGKKASEAIKLSTEAKALLAGSLLVALTFIFSRDYLGLGLETIQTALEGGEVPWYAFILKSFFTSITLSFGGHGGIGTPIFFVGATAGSAFSTVLSVDPAMLSAIGFVALLAGAANTPIAASIMSVELFGAEVAPYAAVACVISFMITGHRSAYPSQVLAVKKSGSIKVEMGTQVSGARAGVEYRERSVIGKLRRLLKKDRGA